MVDEIDVCVLGMHRSGTSLVARILGELGLWLGPEDALMGPAPDNPAGYYEVRRLKEFDDELLSFLGGAWDRPPLLTGDWHLDPELDPWREEAARLIRDEVGEPGDSARPVALKEPRITLLLPFWRTVLPIRSTVAVLRDPREVVASLAARKYAVEPSEGAGLWLRYVCAVERLAPDRLLLRHRDLFDDPEGTVRRICEHVGFVPAADAREQALRAVEHRLHRQVADDDTPTDPLLQLALTVWDEGRFDVDSLGPTVQTLLAEGWLGPHVSDAAAVKARAEAVSFKEQLKRRNERVRELEETLASRP